MGLSIEEQETHVNWSRGDERAKVYASDSTTITKLDKLVNQEGTEWRLEEVAKLTNGTVVGKTYSCPVSCISFRLKKNKRLELSEEEKIRRAELLKRNTL